LATLAACSAGTPARAPADPVVISGPPACGHCRLQMTLEVKLRDRPDVGRQVVGSSQAVARDSTGRIFHVHGMDASSIHVFTADGAYVQSVGSRGQAPGQFSYIYALLVDTDDNLYAFDRERMTVFTPELSVRETKLMPVRVQRTSFTDEGFLVAGLSRREDGVGLPFQVLGSELQILRSFGAVEDLPAPATGRSSAPSNGSRPGPSREACRSRRRPSRAWQTPGRMPTGCCGP
jgi:hypothetical protein